MKTKDGKDVFWTKELREEVDNLFSLGAPYPNADFAAKAYWAASEIVLRMNGIELAESDQVGISA